ncbi:AAA family ATPase [Aquabacter sp. L1I39]|uniref:AAA family ATPase n=1 Tax=Aquabacter sp. L1I39 TaxID=2820278 RepID=UPI001ADB655E|nr:AAA family ATPase [Aquabacter sp. L1I39]QTL03465.1 AAA family ATPase [Aquabacter sp. L1I39]
MHPFERHILVRYVAALATGGSAVWARWWRNTELAHWLLCHQAVLGLPALPTTQDENDPSCNLAARDAALRHFTSLRQGRTPAASPLERKVSWLGDELGLAPIDRPILALLVRTATVPEVHTLALALVSQFIPERLRMPHNMDIGLNTIAALLGQMPRAVSRRLTCEMPLVMYGLVDDRRGHDFAASSRTLKVANASRSTAQTLRALLFGKPKTTSLAWEDFSHLQRDAELVCDLLKAASRNRTRGINILLHGAPGTGKTAFASALAARAGLHAVFVGECAEEGEEPDREQRISALALAQKLSSQSEGLLLVMDEAEDIFVGVDEARGHSRLGAKVFMNNLVEANPCPTLYISNHPHRLGRAVLRRMTYAVEFPRLDRAARERIVRRSATRHKIALDQPGLQELVRLDAPPALIDHGLRTARLCGADVKVAVQAASSVLKVMGGRPAPVDAKARFHPAFACADTDLARLTERIVASGRLDISLCLHGLPGTGKSAYARYLAERMDLEVLEKRASDLLGMFVGQSEQNIADCFEEARARRAFLIFDEADSLLRDRTGASRSHEVSQVNEMLTWMERHPYPFACTTNFADALDPAAARRFLFKIGFLPLAKAQARALFAHTFGLTPPAHLDGLCQLTPGDFAVVARKALVMGETEANALVEALASEVEAKPGGARQPIGFRPLASTP